MFIFKHFTVHFSFIWAHNVITDVNVYFNVTLNGKRLRLECYVGIYSMFVRMTTWLFPKERWDVGLKAAT